jgi:hypothetical protein
MYRCLAQSPLFDKSWYRKHHLSGIEKLQDPIWHYLLKGGKAGVDPSPFFDSSHYVGRNSDVRKSGLNPLFHFEEYGRGERRSPLRSALQTLEFYFPEAAHLPVFTSPQTGQARITMLIDTRTTEESAEVLSELLQAGHRFAEKQSREFRVISSSNKKALLRTILEGLSSESVPLDVVWTTRSDDTITYSIHQDEIFLATSWSSAAALRCVAPYSNVFSVLAEPGKTAAELSAFHSGTWREWALKSATNEETAALRSPRRGKKRTLPAANRPATVGIVVDPQSTPLVYSLLLSDIEKWLVASRLSPNDIAIALFGPNLEPVSLLENFIPVVNDHVSTSVGQELDVVFVCGNDPDFSAELNAAGTRVVDAHQAVTSSGAFMEALSPLLANTSEVAR